MVKEISPGVIVSMRGKTFIGEMDRNRDFIEEAGGQVAVWMVK
jgi:hypothetical protein